MLDCNIKNNKGIKVLSLFDGISCSRAAIEKCGIKINSFYASEINKYAIQITKNNYPDTIQLGDVKEVSLSKFPEINNPDLMILGSPCQDLSIAKKNRQGLKGERSGLFYEAIRIHKEVKPKFFVYENVNSMAQDQKDLMLKAVQEIDSSAYLIMINASLVSGQNRKRIFITNIRNNNSEIPQPEDKEIYLKDILQTDLEEKEFKNYLPLLKNGKEKLESNTIRVSGMGSGIDDKHNWDMIRLVGNVNPSGKGMNGCVYDSRGKSPTLTTNKGEGSKILQIQGVANRTRDGKKQIEFNGKEKANAITSVQTDSMVGIKGTVRIGDIGSKAQAHRVYSPRGKSVAISSLGGGQGAKTGLYLIQTPRGNNKGGKRALDGKTPTLSASSWEHNNKLYKDGVVRKLTCIETERLQSLPDNFTAEGMDDNGNNVKISNSQRYKCVGNGFSVAVVEHIISFMNI